MANDDDDKGRNVRYSDLCYFLIASSFHILTITTCLHIQYKTRLPLLYCPCVLHTRRTYGTTKLNRCAAGCHTAVQVCGVHLLLFIQMLLFLQIYEYIRVAHVHLFLQDSRKAREKKNESVAQK